MLITIGSASEALRPGPGIAEVSSECKDMFGWEAVVHENSSEDEIMILILHDLPQRMPCYLRPHSGSEYTANVNLRAPPQFIVEH